MANRTVKDAVYIKGTNPQYLVEKIIRTRIYDSRYWKEECFALTAELLVDKAMELKSIGGVYGGNVKPSPFLCLILKMLQIQPEKDIIIEFIRNEDFKYVRALGAFYMRLTATSVELYKYLEPLYIDYRKMKRMTKDAKYQLVHMDEFIDELLHSERVCDVSLPRIQKRHVLEDLNEIDPRISALDVNIDEIESSSSSSSSSSSESEVESGEERDRDRRKRDDSRSRRHPRENDNHRRENRREPRPKYVDYDNPNPDDDIKQYKRSPSPPRKHSRRSRSRSRHDDRSHRRQGRNEIDREDRRRDYRERSSDRDKDREKNREREKDRERERKKDRDRERDRDRSKHYDKEKERDRSPPKKHDDSPVAVDLKKNDDHKLEPAKESIKDSDSKEKSSKEKKKDKKKKSKHKKRSQSRDKDEAEPTSS